MARGILVDLLLATGAVDEIESAVEGWDRPAAAGALSLPPTAALYAAAALAWFARFAQSERLADAAKRHPDGTLLPEPETLRAVAGDLPAGRVDRACEQLDATVRAMERFDPVNRRQHISAVLAMALAERGDADAALRTWMKVRMHTESGVSPVLADATHAWCALLHAQAGRLAEAQAELAQHRGLETGPRSYVAGLAPAQVASLRGDAGPTLAAAERTLTTAAGGPILFRYWAGATLVPALTEVGLLERADTRSSPRRSHSSTSTTRVT